MTGMLLAWVVSASLLATPPLQDSRLRRFHLRNGEYIDGRIYREFPNEIEIRLPDGMVLIPRHQVSRVETVKVKTFEPNLNLRSASPKTKSGKVVLPSVRATQSVQQRVEAAFQAAAQGRIDRDEAVKRIVDGGAEAAVLLASNLERFDPQARDLAAKALTILACEKTLPHLTLLLRSADPEVRATSAAQIGHLGIRETWDSLLPLLKDKVGFVRGAAAAALSGVNEPAAFPYVAPLCGDADPLARAAGLQATFELALRNELRESLMWALERALSWPVKGAEIDILQAAASSGFREAWTLAVPRLASPSEELRAAAATAIASLEAKEASAAILDQIGIEGRPAPRIGLALAAERLNLLSAAPGLIEWLSDESPDDSVRRAALRALRAISGLKLGENPDDWRQWWQGREPESGAKTEEKIRNSP